VAGRPFVLAIDGRSSGGKTTLSRQIVDTAPGTAVVHTDDIAWYHSMFGWADLAVELLVPVRRGEPIAYRTPAWDAHGRPGAIVVPAGSPLLVLEGVGSSRRELAHLVDASIWVQSDLHEAERRNTERVLAEEVTRQVQDDWMAQEVPFLADDRPWERAAIIVAGTPSQPLPPGHVLVAEEG